MKSQFSVFLVISFVLLNVMAIFMYHYKSIQYEKVIFNMKVENNKKADELKQENEKIKKENIDLQKKLEANANDGKIAYLTFDDGPSRNTGKILDILKENSVKATFFTIAHTQDIDLYRRIVNEGHSLGNHTYSHNYNSIYKSVNAFKSDFDRMEAFLKEEVGVVPKIIRYPGGSNNHVSWKVGGKDIMNQIINSMTKDGYVHFDWNVDSTDASVALQTKDNIVKSVLDNSKGKENAIILMHDAFAKTTTPEALPEIIRGLKEQGFKFKALNENSLVCQFAKPQK